RRGLGLGVAALEALDPPTGVDQLLLPRIEGVALGAQLDTELRHRAAGHELVPARAMHPALLVLRMNPCLHTHHPTRLIRRFNTPTIPTFREILGATRPAMKNKPNSSQAP